jgi:methyl-accepting chemotaxis protein
VHNAATSLQAASGTLASGSQQNAAAIEQVTATVESFSSSLAHSVNRSQEASGLSNYSTDLVRENSQKMTNLVVNMHELTKASHEVAAITKLTGEIAFKTNLLSLNAAVEAARAGESGKGFAVVADAVRTLASQSAEAAKQIETITRRNSQLSTTGTEQANLTQSTLGEVVEQIAKLDTLLGELGQVFQDQENNAKQITQAIRQVDATVQDSARVSEETASLSDELIANAAQLADAVENLSTLVHGGARAS